METAGTQNTKTSTTFLKRSEYLENKELLLNLSYIKPSFSELKGYLANPYSKRLSVSLVFTFIIYGMHLTNKAPDLTLPPLLETYTQDMTSINLHDIILYVYYAINHMSWILL